MSTPEVHEITRRLVPVDHDTFLDELEHRRIVTRPSPRSRGFLEIGGGARRRSIGMAS